MLNKLYEETLLGVIPREVLIEMSERYRTEKSEKERELEDLNNQIQTYDDAVEDIQKWVSLIRHFMEVQELDRELIHKLVKEIRVGMYTKVDGVKYQDIEIEYNFIGLAE